MMMPDWIKAQISHDGLTKPAIYCEPHSRCHVMSHCVLDPERRLSSLGVKVPEAQVHVRPQPLHALDRQ